MSLRPSAHYQMRLRGVGIARQHFIENMNVPTTSLLHQLLVRRTGGSEDGKGGKQAHGGGGGKGAKGKSKKGKGAAGNGAHAGSKGEEKGSGSGAVVNKMQSEVGDKGKGGSEVETKGGGSSRTGEARGFIYGWLR